MSVALENRSAGIMEQLSSWGCRPEICTTASPFVARTLKNLFPEIEVRGLETEEVLANPRHSARAGVPSPAADGGET